MILPGSAAVAAAGWFRMVAALLLLGMLFRPGSARAQDLAQFQTLLSQGDSAWRAGRFPVAKASYQSALAVDSVGSPIAVYRLAVLHSWDGELPTAIPLFRRYIRLEPRDEEGRVALARAYAWNGETGRSVALYDSILGRDGSYRDAALGAALALAWAGRYDTALARYDRWLGDHPRDVEAELARARTLAWWGKLDQAESTYATIAGRGEQLEAEKGLALVAAWRGDLGASEDRWRAITERVPNDDQAWVGLAQVLRWSGRPEDARDALAQALAAKPTSGDAAEQLRWVRGDLASTVEPTVSYAWDSDANRSVVASGGVGFRPFRRGRLTLLGSQREAELGATRGHGTTARAVLRFGVGRRLSLTADAGATRMSGSSPTDDGLRTLATGGITATVKLGARLAVGGTVRRSAFDETATLLLSGIEVRSVAAEGTWEPLGRLAFAGGFELASLRGGSGPNERRAAFGAVRWRARRQLLLVAAGRRFSYDEQRRDGYFSPSAYLLGEGSARWTIGRNLGWFAATELGLGAQRVSFSDPGDVRGTQRLSLGIGYRPVPGSEIGFDYGFSNVSGAAAEGTIYRAHVASLRARIVW